MASRHLVFAHQVEQSHVHPRGRRTFLILVHCRRAYGEAGGALIPHREQGVGDAPNHILRKGRLPHPLGDRLQARIGDMRCAQKRPRTIRNVENARKERVADPARHGVSGGNGEPCPRKRSEPTGFAAVAGGPSGHDRFNSLQYPWHCNRRVLAHARTKGMRDSCDARGGPAL